VLAGVRANPLFATALGVHQRVRDVEGGPLASAVTLTFFLTLFPVLLVAIAGLGFVAADNADLAADLIEDLGLTGDVADMVATSVDAARDSRGATTILGFLGVLWVAVGLGAMVSQVCNRPWQLPVRGLRGRLVSLGWLLGAIALLGGAIFATGLLEVLPGWLSPLQVLAGLALLVGFFLFTFRLLTNHPMSLRTHLPGALAGAVGVQVLNLFGALLLGNYVAGASALYGSIGVVLGLLAWLLLFGRLLVYAVCLNVVLHERAHGTVTVEIEVPRFAGEVPLQAERSGAVKPREA
jgi:membrane protein